MLSVGKLPNHHANPVRHALRRYFHAMPRWQRNQLLKQPGAIVNQLYTDLKKKSELSFFFPSNSRAARSCCDTGALAVFLSAVAKESYVSGNNIDHAYGMRMLQETLHAIVGMASGDIKKSGIRFGIAGYDFLAQARLSRSVDAIRKEFCQHLQNTLPALKPNAARWLAIQLLAGYEAVLDRTDVPGDCVYGGLVFSDIQAGIDTAVAINIDPCGQTWETLVGLADTIDIAARSNPDFDPLFYQPQIEAALRFANARHHIDIHRDGITGAGLTQAIADRDRARIAARNSALEPVRKAIAFLQRPTPDRLEIAERLLTALEVNPYEIGDDTRIRMTGAGLCSGNRQLRQFYLDECEFRLIPALRRAGRQLSDLGDLDAQYSRELDTFFTELTQSTATLIAVSVKQLDPNDYSFWKNNPAQLLQPVAAVTELSATASGNFGAQALPRKKTSTITGERTLLYVVGDDNARRFYQVSLADAQISLDAAGSGSSTGTGTGIVKRIRLAAGDTIDNHIDVHRERFFEVAALEQIPARARKVVYGTQPLGPVEIPPHAGPSVQAAAAAFSSFIREAQYEQGYKPTGLQQFRRTMGSLAKSLLPFHDCVAFVNAGRQAEAIADCSIEALNILPLSRLILFSQTLRKPLTHAFIRGISVAAEHGLTPKNAWKTLAIAADMQTTLQAAGKGLAAGLGKDLVSAIDPGFDAVATGYRLSGLHARLARRDPLRSLGRLIAAQPKKNLLLQEILGSDPRTRTLSAMLKKQARQPYRYDRLTDGWYRQANGVEPVLGSAAGATERRYAQSPGDAEGHLRVVCAERLPDYQCSMFVKQNPVTQKTYGSYLRPIPGNRGSLRLMLPPAPVYPAGKFTDDIGTGYKFSLPRGAEIENLGFLRQHPQYRDLPESVVLLELDGKHYVWDGNQPSQGLRKVTGDLLDKYVPALCRDKRSGVGGTCGVSIKRLPAGNSVSRHDSFQLLFGRGNHEVTQYDPAIKKDLVSIEAIEILYRTPPVRRPGKSRKPQHLILTPDRLYQSQQENDGLWLRQINDIDAAGFGVDGVGTTIPETGNIVRIANPRAETGASAAPAGGLRAIEIQLENGRHRCTHRVVFGTYSSHQEKMQYGMIRLGESNDSYYRFAFTARALATGQVALTPATQTDIDNYRRFQDMKSGRRRRRKFNTGHHIQLNHGDAGSLLRIYEHYDLAPYRQLLPEIASQFGVNQIRAAAMVDAYIKNPSDPERKPELEKLKDIFETSLHAQFSSPEAVDNLYERITDAIDQADGPLRIRWVALAPDDLDEIMSTLADRYPDMALPLANYKSMVGNGKKFSARDLRMLVANGLSNTVGPKNVAFARIQFHEDGVLGKQETIHSISGKQQANSDSYSHIRVHPLTSSSFDADAIYAAAEQTQGPDADALLYFSDYDQSGKRRIRAFDAEIKTIGLIRQRLLDAGNNAAIHSIKMFTRLAPCVVCTQAIAILSKEYPAIPIEVVHFARRRKSIGAAAGAGNR